MHVSSEAFNHQVIAAIVFGYIAFCFFYGYSSLKSRRASTQKMTDGPKLSLQDSFRRFGFALKVSMSFLLPVALVSGFLSLTGRERIGIVEPHNLFVISQRHGETASFLADEGPIHKDGLVARFASDALQHRLSALRSRRHELVADRETIKLSALPMLGELTRDLQAYEHKANSAEQRLTELERAMFSANRQLIANRINWQTAKHELVSQQPIQEQLLDLLREELGAAEVRLKRIVALRAKEYTTIVQLEQSEHTKAVAENRVNAAELALKKIGRSIASLDADHKQTEELLKGRIEKLEGDATLARTDYETSQLQLARIRRSIDAGKDKALARREQEIAAATSRIAKLDDEIAVVVANTQIKSPIDGRVIYRSTASASLTGSHPLAIVAASNGFVLRVSLLHDELPALQEDVRANHEIRVIIQDESAKRIVRANVIKTEVDQMDQKRVRVTFGLDVPEDMLVRMALKGTTPRGHLQWHPTSSSVIAARVAKLFGSSISDGLNSIAAKIRQLPTVLVRKTQEISEPELLSL